MIVWALLASLLVPARASEFSRIMTTTPPGEPEERIARLANALKAWTPQDSRQELVSALCELGKELVYESRQKEALPFLDRALQVDKRDACSLRWKAEAFASDFLYPRARPIIRQLLRVDPRNLNGRQLECRADLAMRDYPAAVRSCEAFVALGGSTQTTQLRMAEAYAYAGRAADAERAWRLSMEGPLGANIPQGERSRLEMERRTVEAAVWGWGRSADRGLAILDKALEDYEGHMMVLYMRARLHHHLGRYERAVSDFTAAALRNPRHPGVYVGRAESYTRLGRHDEAARDRAEACRLGWTTLCPPKGRRSQPQDD